MKEIKWTQWTPTEGLIRCGFNEYKTLMDWMRDLGHDAARCLERQEKPHAVYGRIIRNEAGEIDEIRFYADTYMTDEELDKISKDTSPDYLYAVHKRERA